MDLPSRVLEAIKLASMVDGAGLHEPTFSGNEKHYLAECIDSTFVSSVGQFVPRFEQAIQDYTGIKHAVAVVNGTVALQVALELAEVREGDEVLVPALTFVATANAVSHAGATPNFVDVSEHDLGIDPVALRKWLEANTLRLKGKTMNRVTGREIAAILPVHVFGHPCKIDELVNLANDYKLALIEDSTESLGSFYKGKHTGSFGKLGVLSFNGNKIITTGGGGAILTNDDELADKARHVTTTSKVPHRWEYIHDEIGYNFRMPNINAAIGLAQMELLGTTLSKKRELAERYKKYFTDVNGVTFLSEPNNSFSNYWLNTILIDSESSHLRHEILKVTNDNNFQTRPIWKPLPELKPYSKHPKTPTPIAEDISKRLINIPSGLGALGLNN